MIFLVELLKIKQENRSERHILEGNGSHIYFCVIPSLAWYMDFNLINVAEL